MDYFEELTERLPAAEWCFDQKRNAMDTFLRALEMAEQKTKPTTGW